MIRPAPIGMLLILWFIGEYIAFTYVISVIGLGGAVLVGVATFLLGINSLRHIGLTAFSRIRQQANPSRTGMEPVIHSVGAILLIVPGFLSDLIGLALLAPSLRSWIATRGAYTPSGRRPNPDPNIIDLDESDWRHIDESPNDH